ncbi:hypothetical protein FM106_15935 [Brachybacterium faecium]|nr:hypothetical protein FM106_15935 [Brachybacterium faecium]
MVRRVVIVSLLRSPSGRTCPVRAGARRRCRAGSEGDLVSSGWAPRGHCPDRAAEGRARRWGAGRLLRDSSC